MPYNLKHDFFLCVLKKFLLLAGPVEFFVVVVYACERLSDEWLVSMSCARRYSYTFVKIRDCRAARWVLYLSICESPPHPVQVSDKTDLSIFTRIKMRYHYWSQECFTYIIMNLTCTVRFIMALYAHELCVDQGYKYGARWAWSRP